MKNQCTTLMQLAALVISLSIAALAQTTQSISIISPVTVHGNNPAEPHDHYLTGAMALTGTSDKASSFAVDTNTWGPGEPQLQRFFDATNRTGVRLDSSDYKNHSLKLTTDKPEKLWDVWSSIASSGSNDGDTVRFFVIDANGVEHDFAVGYIWTGMVKFTLASGIRMFIINPFEPQFLTLMEPPSMDGMFIIPMVKPAGENITRTEPFFLSWDMTASGPLFGCARLGVEIKRLTGPGHVAVVIDDVVVKRNGPTRQGNGILFGVQNGSYPGGESECGQIPQGQATCFRTPAWFLRNLSNNIPDAFVTYVGMPSADPLNTSNRGVMNILLGGNGSFYRRSPEQLFNAEWIASQWSLAFAGGPVILQGIRNGQLGLYSTLTDTVSLSADFTVILYDGVTLSNGHSITRRTTLGQLHQEAEWALTRRTQGLPEAQLDLIKLAAVFKLLNQCRQ